MSQKEKILDLFSDGSQHSIEEVHKSTGILRPNVRRILGQGAKEGEFTRIDKGIYTLTTADGKVTAFIEAGCAETTLPRLVEEGMKFDTIILDPAYFSRALIGGNRGIKDYGFIMPDEFAIAMQSVAKLLRNDKCHCYLMLSGAASAQADMQEYLDAALASGLKLVKEGTYTKLFSRSKEVTNVRGETAQPERLFLLTLSGTMEGEVEMHFRFPRPKGYQTEKAQRFIRSLIEQATKVGDWVGDFFAGSGVTGEQCVLAERNVYLIDKSAEVVQNLIFPRVRKAIYAYNSLNS